MEVLARTQTFYGAPTSTQRPSRALAETISQDMGKTWPPVEKLAIQHCTSRFFLRRLQSGALLLVKHGGIHVILRLRQ
jgi:hypothetical protein